MAALYIPIAVPYSESRIIVTMQLFIAICRSALLTLSACSLVIIRVIDAHIIWYILYAFWSQQELVTLKYLPKQSALADGDSIRATLLNIVLYVAAIPNHVGSL